MCVLQLLSHIPDTSLSFLREATVCDSAADISRPSPYAFSFKPLLCIKLKTFQQKKKIRYAGSVIIYVSPSNISEISIGFGIHFFIPFGPFPISGS